MLRLQRGLRAPVIAGLILSTAVTAWLGILCNGPAHAQGTVGFGQIRPFVIGFIPVPGRNGVGGVLIDAKGALNRIDVDRAGKLRRIRLEAIQPVPPMLGRRVPLRKISLKRLEAAILKAGKTEKRLPEAIQYLGGLQRVEFVIAYPDQQDIVLAGPAEGWVVGPRNGVSPTRWVSRWPR